MIQCDITLKNNKYHIYYNFLKYKNKASCVQQETFNIVYVVKKLY